MINLQCHKAGGSGEVAATAASSWQRKRRALKREQFIDASVKVKDFPAALMLRVCGSTVTLLIQEPLVKEGGAIVAAEAIHADGLC